MAYGAKTRPAITQAAKSKAQGYTDFYKGQQGASTKPYTKPVGGAATKPYTKPAGVGGDFNKSDKDILDKAAAIQRRLGKYKKFGKMNAAVKRRKKISEAGNLVGQAVKNRK